MVMPTAGLAAAVQKCELDNLGLGGAMALVDD